jgi:hypothetical protein
MRMDYQLFMHQLTMTTEAKTPSFYEAKYLVHGYVVADAFRSSPAWGKARARVDASETQGYTDIEIVSAAKQSAPFGYSLKTVTEFADDGTRRELYDRKVPFNSSKENS